MSTQPNSNATSTSDRQTYPSSGASSTRCIMPSERHNSNNQTSKYPTQAASSSHDNSTANPSIQQHSSGSSSNIMIGNCSRQSFIDNNGVAPQTTINLATVNRGSRRGSSRVNNTDSIVDNNNVARLTPGFSVPSVMLHKAESDSNISNISAARSAPPPGGPRSDRTNSSFCIRQRHHPVDFERGHLKISAPIVEEIIKNRRTFILLAFALLYALYGFVNAFLSRPSLSHSSTYVSSSLNNNGSSEEWTQEMIAGWYRDRPLELVNPVLELSSGNENDTSRRHIRIRECRSQPLNLIQKQQLSNGNDLQEKQHNLEGEVREQLHEQEHLLERHQISKFKQLNQQHQPSTTLAPTRLSGRSKAASNNVGSKNQTQPAHDLPPIAAAFLKKRRKFEALNGCFFRRDISSESLGDLCCCSGNPRYVLVETPFDISRGHVPNSPRADSKREFISTKRPENGTNIHSDTAQQYLINPHVNLSTTLHPSKAKLSSDSSVEGLLLSSSSEELPIKIKQQAGMNSTGESEKLAQQTNIISSKNENYYSKGNNNTRNNKTLKVPKRKYLRPQIMCFVSAAANIFNSQKLVAPIANEVNLRNTFVRDKGKCITCSCCHEHDPETVNKLLANVPLYPTESKSMMLDKNGNQLIKPSNSENHDERRADFWVRMRNHLSSLMQHLDDFFFWLYDVLDYSILIFRYGIYPIQNFTDSTSFILIQSAIMRPNSFDLAQPSPVSGSLKSLKTTEQPSLYIDADSYNDFTTTTSTTSTTKRPRHLSTRRGSKSAAERRRLRARRRRLRLKKEKTSGRMTTTTPELPRAESTIASKETKTSTLIPVSKSESRTLLPSQANILIKSPSSSSTTKTPTVIINVYAGNNNTPLDRSSTTTTTTSTSTKSPSSSSTTTTTIKEAPRTTAANNKPLQGSSIGERLDTSKSASGNFEFRIKLDGSSSGKNASNNSAAFSSSSLVPVTVKTGTQTQQQQQQQQQFASTTAGSSGEPTTIKTMTRATNESLEILARAFSGTGGSVAQEGASKSVAAAPLSEAKSGGAIRKTINLANDTLFAFQSGNPVIRQAHSASSKPMSLESERLQQLQLQQLPLQQARAQLDQLNGDNFQNASSTSSKPAIVISLDGTSNSSTIIAAINTTELSQRPSQIHTKGSLATSTISRSSNPVGENNLGSKGGPLFGEGSLGAVLDPGMLSFAGLPPPPPPPTLESVPVDLNVAGSPVLTAINPVTLPEIPKFQLLGPPSTIKSPLQHNRSSQDEQEKLSEKGYIFKAVS